MTRAARTLLAVAALLVARVAGAEPPAADAAQTVVFVCEHGSVKSLMASEYFNQAAAERHLPFKSVARGVRPDAAVPERILERLKAEGFDAAAFRPRAVASADLSGAARVVTIGVEAAGLPGADDTAPLEWNDVPPASADYAAASRRLRQHVDELLDELAEDAGTPP